MKYQKEYTILSKAIKDAYHDLFINNNLETKDKAKFDIVTVNDINIEKRIIDTINTNFPNDRIQSEESNPNTQLMDRTWVIDPIDGTFNMARNIPLFAIQCALYLNNEIVFSIIYLPKYDELYHAEIGQGAFLNDKPIKVAHNSLEHAIVSFGDFSHTRKDDFEDQHKIYKSLSAKIAKVRMYGSAAIDFSFVASGKTDGTVIFTKNKWDIAPGILISKEAGASIYSLDDPYTNDSRVVIATSSKELYECIIKSYKE